MQEILNIYATTQLDLFNKQNDTIVFKILLKLKTIQICVNISIISNVFGLISYNFIYEQTLYRVMWACDLQSNRMEPLK